MQFNKEFWNKLDEHISLGNVSKTKHPTLDLYVLCYTKQCQYDANWDDVTTRCRGMVIDGQNNIVSLCVPKFFNDFELEKMGVVHPLCSFDIYEKVDGSLIHLWNYEGVWHFSSKGSFISDQAVWAKEIFESLYSYDHLDTDIINYVFEVLHPENRIVIDYKSRKDLVLLTAFERSTHQEVDLLYPDFPKPQKYDGMNLNEIKAKFNHLKGTEAEGFVIKFDNNFRMKIKLDPYCELHRVMTGISERIIWERLKNNETFDIYNDLEDEEVRHWIFETRQKLVDQFNETGVKCLKDFNELWDRTIPKFPEDPKAARKEYAIELIKMKHPHQGVLFSLSHGHDVSEQIWDYLYPAGNKTFRLVGETNEGV